MNVITREKKKILIVLPKFGFSVMKILFYATPSITSCWLHFTHSPNKEYTMPLLLFLNMRYYKVSPNHPLVVIVYKCSKSG